MHIVLRLLFLAFCLSGGVARAAGDVPKITILYDAFGADRSLRHGWGYSALVEYHGRRILFDTGGNLQDFRYNVEKLHVDLTHLDFVVLSHRHGDHTGGLNFVLSINPGVQIYTPVEQAGFGTPRSDKLMKMIARKVEGTPPDMLYFDGTPPEVSVDTPPWPEAHFKQVRQTSEVLPGFFLVTNQSDKEGTREMNEISLAFRTPKGLVVVVGCSHPGIEKILASITPIDGKIHALFGGLHLVDASDPDVTALITDFRDKWRIEQLASGHCSGPFAFAEAARLYGDRFFHPGVGAVIEPD